MQAAFESGGAGTIDPWKSIIDNGEPSNKPGILEPASSNGINDEINGGSEYLSHGDYSARLDEILNDEDKDTNLYEGVGDDSGVNADEGFHYSGVDAQEAGDYKQQLRDVLGSDGGLSDESRKEVEELTSFVQNEEESDEEFSYEQLSRRPLSPVLPETPSSVPSTPLKRPFLHPSVSRLRSYTPRHSSYGSDLSNATLISPPPSHFSSFSRASSISEFKLMNGSLPKPREAFRWSTLRILGDELTRSEIDGATSKSVYGKATVMASNGLVCIGTTLGRVLVFDFKQSLKYVCGNPQSGIEHGAVTALALSQDHTFVASGHASGYIFLYNLAKPGTPARTVPTTTLQAVASGRKEGHMANIPINRIGFVGKRHTAIVSSDENGLAFYHSLGKALFFEANDVLRVLGKYPDKEEPKLKDARSKEMYAQRKNNTILAMAPLPLGATADPIDEYNLVALITPVKLIVVGLKPSPRTWYRQHREISAMRPASRWRGCLAWYPRTKQEDGASTPKAKNGVLQTNVAFNLESTRPMLVYAWGSHFSVLRIREEKTTTVVKNPKTGKDTPVVTGKVLFDEQVRWSAEEDLLAVQWITSNLILGVTSSSVGVWDTRSGTCTEHSSLATPLVSIPLQPLDESIKVIDPGADFAQSVRTYKGKVFLLSREGVKVGTLLTWADRILSLVQDGDFLGAIDLTRAYYVIEAPGNRLGLPTDPTAACTVIGAKLRELMVASASYAFSEDRLTDKTHITADGRGVDRTSLFEGMVATCAKACIALEDFDFLYEDLFERYNNWKITTIFLTQIEPFLLDNLIQFVPPRITQRIIAHHAEAGELDAVEKLIWHIDPQCLDIDQAINLCKRYDLWDAMIYVYTAALQDYVSPVVEFLSLIRRLLQKRASEYSTEEPDQDRDQFERRVSTAYKIFPYLSNLWSGHSFPSQVPMQPAQASAAKHDLYSFLFFGRSSIWPKGPGSKPVLTAIKEGDEEPTYPYLRLLLCFDTEACLHTLDIAFEDSFLNDRGNNISRLVIIKILLELQGSQDIPSADTILIDIFIARNIPKYPQYLDLVTPSTLQNVLVALIREPDSNTREDRQLAAEYLLSTYTPQRTEHLIEMLQEAKFYRILRSWFRQDHRYKELFRTYVEDADMSQNDFFDKIEQVFAFCKQHGSIRDDLTDTLAIALPRFLEAGVTETATLLDTYFPQQHHSALLLLESDAAKQFAYLRSLLEPLLTVEDSRSLPPLSRRSRNIAAKDYELYIQLLYRFEPAGMIRGLREVLPKDSDWVKVEQMCTDIGAFGAVIWSLDARGQSLDGFSRLKRFSVNLTEELIQRPTPESSLSLASLQFLFDVGLEVCQKRSVQHAEDTSMPVEDMWLAMLASQIDIVQVVSGHLDPKQHQEETQHLLVELRQSVQHTFTVLMALGSSSGVELSHLFKRLVDATSETRSINNPSYSEFRIILSGMLDSYRFEEDVLVSSTHLIGRDLLDAIGDLSKIQNKGWKPTFTHCDHCHQRVLGPYQPSADELKDSDRFVISRTGAVHHEHCFALVSN